MRAWLRVADRSPVGGLLMSPTVCLRAEPACDQGQEDGIENVGSGSLWEVLGGGEGEEHSGGPVLGQPITTGLQGEAGEQWLIYRGGPQVGSLVLAGVRPLLCVCLGPSPNRQPCPAVRGS